MFPEKDPSYKSYLIQAGLKSLGFDIKPDNWWGKKTEAAYQAFLVNQEFMSARIFPGWEWLPVQVVGADLVVRGTIATWFGGDSDPMDSGETASGVLTRGNPLLLGCALPRNYTGSHRGNLEALGGSPIPSFLPFHTLVEVTRGDLSITVPFIDIGPARYTHHGIDLTIEAFKQLGLSLEEGVGKVDYRVIGGASYA